MTGNRLLIACAMLCCTLAISACGKQSNLVQTAPKSPELALPSGAYLAIGFQPKEIAANPVLTQLRAAIGQGDGDLPFLGGLRSALGLDPQKDIASGVWALYDFVPPSALWCMALSGNLDEASVLRAIASVPGDPIEPKSREYLGLKFTAVTSGPVVGRQESGTYMVFPAPGFLVVSNNEPLLKKCIAVWRGKADALPSNSPLSPVYKEATATPSPLWAAGLAQKTLTQISMSSGYLSRADSLGAGVQGYRAAIHLAADRIGLEGEFHCDNTGSALKQSQNYQTLIEDYMKRLIPLWGPAPLSLLKGLKLEPQGADVLLSYDLAAADAVEIAKQFDQAAQTMSARNASQEMLRRGLVPPAGAMQGMPFAPGMGASQPNAPSASGGESLPPPAATPGGATEDSSPAATPTPAPEAAMP